MEAYIDDSDEDSDLQDPVPQYDTRRSKSPLSTDGEDAHNSADEMDFMKVTSEKDQVLVIILMAWCRTHDNLGTPTQSG